MDPSMIFRMIIAFALMAPIGWFVGTYTQRLVARWELPGLPSIILMGFAIWGISCIIRKFLGLP